MRADEAQALFTALSSLQLMGMTDKETGRLYLREVESILRDLGSEHENKKAYRLLVANIKELKQLLRESEWTDDVQVLWYMHSDGAISAAHELDHI